MELRSPVTISFSLVFLVVIFLLATGCVFPKGESSPEKQISPDAPRGTTAIPAISRKNSNDLDRITIRTFGDESFVMADNESLSFEEKTALLANVSADSEKDLSRYDYPPGPLLGTGYSRDEIIVSMHRNRAVNEDVIQDIYSVVERHGEEYGIQRIPCRFISMGPLKLEQSNNSPMG